MMGPYSGPKRTKCPKCNQLGFQLDYHGSERVGRGGCTKPMFCRSGLDRDLWDSDPEHIVMTCETCGYMVRKEIDYFENGE